MKILKFLRKLYIEYLLLTRKEKKNWEKDTEKTLCLGLSMTLGCIVYTIIHHIYNDKIWNVYAFFKIWNSIYKNLSLLDAIANWRISISMILFLGILLISFALMTVKVDGYSIKTGLLIYMIKGCYYTQKFK